MISPKDIDIIFYHYPCQDGLTAGWVADKYAKENKLNYSLYGLDNDKKLLPVDITGKNLLFMDIAPNEERYKKILAEAKSFYVLDHHKTNQAFFETLDNKTNFVFDMKKSGCRLAWEYFYPTVKVPEFLLMVEDRDLWKWELPESKPFCHGLYTYSACSDTIGESFGLMTELCNNPNKVKEVTELGRILQKKMDNNVKFIAENTCKKTYIFRGKKVCMANVSHELASDLGNYLCSNYDYDFAVLWRYDHVTDDYNISMRSVGDKMDVSLLCKEFGGGGHKNAAGCSTKDHPCKVFGQ